ncbi:hypothetical protein AGMMS49992_28780 [Clostridia bacterium]|nr:hypothetical protein AGMMS49992_28780 [Clostridia bacterium]
MNQLRLYIRVQRGERGIIFITVLTVTLAAAIVSVMLFIRANSQDFVEHQQRVLVDCDVRVELSALLGALVQPTPEQTAFLDQLRGDGCRIKSYRQYARLARVKGGTDIIVFRLVPDDELHAYGVTISLAAADTLGLRVGDMYSAGDGAPELPVLAVEYVPAPEIRMSQLGIIILPESAAIDINIERLLLYIQIRAPESASESERERIVAAVIDAFPNRQNPPEELVRTYARDAESLLEEHIAMQYIIERVLLALAVASIFLAAGGIAAVTRLRTERRKQSFALLRVNGMTRKDANRFALVESAAVALVGCVVGMAVGFAVYRGIALRMTGLPPIFGIISGAFWVTAVKTAVLPLLVLNACARWANRLLFDSSVMQIRQQRETLVRRSRANSFKNVGRIVGYAMGFAALLTVMLFNGGAIGDVVYSFGFNILIIVAVSLLFMIIYGVFSLCIKLLGLIRLHLSGLGTLSARLMVKRRRDSALIGTALSAGLAMLLIFYNVSSGMDLYFARVWEYEMLYGASVQTSDSADAGPILTANGFAYDTIYTKSFIAPDPPPSNAGRAYVVAILRKGEGSNVELRVEPGTFAANWFFLFNERVEVGESFAFFGELELLCAREISNLNTTGMMSSVTFSAVLDYADAGDYIDDTWSTAYLLQPTQAQKARLVELGSEQGWYVTTPERHADSIRAVYAAYLSLIYLVCVLLSVAVLVFIFSLTMVSAMTRRREFAIYRVYGASGRSADGIVMLENAFIAVVAACLTTAQVLGIFKLVGMALTSLGGVSYTMPVWVMAAAVGISAGFNSLVALGVMRALKSGRTVDILREE